MKVVLHIVYLLTDQLELVERCLVLRALLNSVDITLLVVLLSERALIACWNGDDYDQAG